MTSYLSLLALLLVPLSIYGNPNHCDHQVLEHFQSVGQIEIHACKILGRAQLLGNIQARDSIFHQIIGHGNITLHTCTIDAMHVSGNLHAHHTDFQGPIEIHGNHLSLSHSKAQNIILYSSEPSLIELVESKVSGNIKFVGHPGMVRSRMSSISGTITHGEKKNT